MKIKEIIKQFFTIKSMKIVDYNNKINDLEELIRILLREHKNKYFKQIAPFYTTKEELCKMFNEERKMLESKCFTKKEFNILLDSVIKWRLLPLDIYKFSYSIDESYLVIIWKGE